MQRTVLTYRASRLLIRALLAPFTCRHVLGAEHIPRSGPFLLAANHISHFDPLLLGVALPRAVDWMATAEFFSPAPLGAWMRAVGTFPVDRAGRDPRALREAARRLRAGHGVGVFPEGGLRAGAVSVLEGAPLRANLGRLALLGQASVLPCVILGTDRLYNPHRWYPFCRRAPVWIGFAPPLPPSVWADAPPDFLGSHLRLLAKQMQQHFQLRPDDWPTTPQRRKGRL